MFRTQRIRPSGPVLLFVCFFNKKEATRKPCPRFALKWKKIKMYVKASENLLEGAFKDTLYGTLFVFFALYLCKDLNTYVTCGLVVIADSRVCMDSVLIYFLAFHALLLKDTQSKFDVQTEWVFLTIKQNYLSLESQI